jgi:hypothetical protein
MRRYLLGQPFLRRKKERELIPGACRLTSAVVELWPPAGKSDSRVPI